LALSDVDKIKYTVWRSYFSFFRGIKSANTRVFKDFYNEEEMEKNKSDGELYFIVVTKPTILKTSIVCLVKSVL
jgi:hypothetical protein